MTRENWKKVEEHLKWVHRTAILICDGYEVTLRKVQVDARRVCIGVYVNGWFKGEWFVDKSAVPEEVRRFFPLKSAPRYERLFVKEMTKIVGVREARKRGYFARVEHRLWQWPSFRGIPTHFEKHNKEISIKELLGAYL